MRSVANPSFRPVRRRQNPFNSPLTCDDAIQCPPHAVTAHHECNAKSTTTQASPGAYTAQTFLNRGDRGLTGPKLGLSFHLPHWLLTRTELLLNDSLRSFGANETTISTSVTSPLRIGANQLEHFCHNPDASANNASPDTRQHMHVLNQ